MIDASAHELDKTQVMKSGLQLRVTGQRNGVRETINSIMLRPFSQKTDYQFKYIVKKISTDFNNIQIQFKSTGNVIMVNFVIDPENRHQIETGEISYFHLKKDQNLLYKIPADPDAA